ncbi:MAG: tetratricopeptide repeat protein [Litorilinea sp.]
MLSPIPQAASPLTAGASGNEYGSIFESYVGRSLEMLARQLEQVEGLLAQELQARFWQTLEYGLRIRTAWPATRALLLAVAPKIEQTGTWDEWLPCLGKSIERSQAVDDKAAEAELRMHLGHLLFRVGEVETARHQLELAGHLFGQLGQMPRHAVALARLAQLVHRADGDAHAARDLAERALRMVTRSDLEAAYCHFVHGTLAGEELAVGEAAAALDEARRLAEQAGDRRLHALALLNLGRLYAQRTLYEPAETYYEWAIAAFVALEDPVNLAVAQMNLAIIYMESGKYNQALRRYDEAETTLRPLHDRRYLAMIYNNKGMVYTEMQDWARAEEAYLAACGLWRQLDEPVSLANVMDNLGELYMAQGAPRQAVATFADALALLHTGHFGSAEARRLGDEIAAHLEIARAQSPDAAPRSTVTTPVQRVAIQ